MRSVVRQDAQHCTYAVLLSTVAALQHMLEHSQLSMPAGPMLPPFVFHITFRTTLC